MRNYMLQWLLVVIALTTSIPTIAQYDHFTGIFTGTRIVNGHSLETRKTGELEMLISHRFGRVNRGGYDFFGLDQATIRLGLEYSLWDGFMVGVGRSSLEKTYDGFVKIRFFRQSKGGGGMPFAATFLSTVAYRTLRDNDPVRSAFQSSRLFYAYQFLIGGKIGERFSWQLMPGLVHRNYVENDSIPHDVLSLGVATKFVISKNLSFVFELHPPLSQEILKDHNPSMSLGLDIITGGHVFQVHLTNSRGMIEKFFIAETTGAWGNSDVHVGFNISRIFKVKGRWY